MSTLGAESLATRVCRRRRTRVVGLAVVLAAFSVALVAPAGAGAATNYCVPNANFAGCPGGSTAEPTVRSALDASVNTDFIYIGKGTFTEGLPTPGGFATNYVIGHAITIVGAGGKTVLKPLNAGPVIVNNSPGVTINGVTIDGGFTDGNDPAAPGIYNNPGNDVTLNNSTVSNNQGANGGGIANPGGAECTANVVNTSVVTLNNSTVTANSAFIGGGINNGDNGCGGVTVTNSTVSNNTATACGGGIANNQGGSNPGEGSNLSVSGSTISGNQTLPSPPGCIIFGGAGVWNGGNATLTKTTVRRNTTPAAGGGALAVGSNSLLTVNSTTFSSNRAQSGGAIGIALGGLVTVDQKSVVCGSGNSPNDYPGC